MIVEIILVITFVLFAAGDCYSTAILLRHNEKMMNDKKYARKVRYKISKEMKNDVSKSEMMPLAAKIIKKYGGDRAMLYIGVFGYGPLSLFLLYSTLNGDMYNLLFSVLIVGFLMGALFVQIMKALTLKKRFDVDVWSD